MDVRERVGELVAGTEVLPPTEDPATVFSRGRRRARRRRATVVGSALGVGLVAAVALVVLPDGSGAPPVIGDGPQDADIGEDSEADDIVEPEVTIPDGWQTLTAGEIAVSVPADWEVVHPLDAMPFDPHDVPDDTHVGGPCMGDLHAPGGDVPPDGPTAVVYDAPTDGACRLIGYFGPPPHPGLVLYETTRGIVDGVEGQPGAERIDIEQRAERDRIGVLEVWRSVDDQPFADMEPSGTEFYVAVELTGGIWASHPDDPVVQRILATARPAEGVGDAD